MSQQNIFYIDKTVNIFPPFRVNFHFFQVTNFLVSLFLFHPIRKSQTCTFISVALKRCHCRKINPEYRSSFAWIFHTCAKWMWSTVILNQREWPHKQKQGKLAAFEKREPKYCWNSAMESSIPYLWKISITNLYHANATVDQTPISTIVETRTVLLPCHKTPYM